MFALILGFLKIFEFLLTEMESGTVDSDSLRCVGGHWSRTKTFDRSKLDFAGGTELQIPFWDIFDDF